MSRPESPEEAFTIGGEELNKVFALVDGWDLKCKHILINPTDCRDIMEAGGKEFPWTPEEIPANAVVEIHNGEMSLVIIED